ncbi:hypothetical protein BT93_L4889 [Corymbia citriodora subsp. variegata]|uniref:DUF4220 domain-containing protein n=1 Tax=Corymbia citriodora subsp. variegata TaxID=360336 RepID=A0A8T0CTV0_CORYI|nr:hypothetical protein BT93_L4889 [Corymbia citriodora subsp. variegata]
MELFSWVPLVIEKCFPWLMDLWEAWSIQLLVLTGLIFQIILAIFGGRRRYITGPSTRFVVWSSYLLATYVAALALGKLTVIRVNDPEKPDYDTELKALLAPLLLMQLGYPDSITAYSVEDNRLGIRQVLNFVFTVAFVVWILIRCWDSSAAASLYFPIFVSGMIKYGETIWALKSVYSENMSITLEDIDEENNIPKLLQELPTNIPDLDFFVKAYYRFDTLKPHLENWPIFVSRKWMSLEEYNVENVYLTTAIELGFMYDVIFTKGPVLYTRRGITLRFISFFCLVLTLSGFAGIFQDIFLLDMYVAYTYALLIGVTILEIYQILALPYSDWAIVKMVEHHRKPFVKTLLPFLVKMSMKKKRSSDMIGQFNMLDYCLHDKWLKFIKVPEFVGEEKQLRRYLKSTHKAIDTDLKELLLEGMKELERKRGQKPFTSRGQWTLELHNSSRELQWSIETGFDRSIVTWHMATEICYHSNFWDTKNCSGSKVLSDYMMYLLAIRPYVLSLPTNEITLEHAYSNVKKFLVDSNLGDRDGALKKLSSERVQGTDSGTGPKIFKEWHVLEEAQRLANLLNNVDDPWKLISSVWVEMMCYTAYNCQIYNHTKLLRRGGDILTHVWLLLAHKTDKFNYMKNTT